VQAVAGKEVMTTVFTYKNVFTCHIY
jgi:hypothetical protein